VEIPHFFKSAKPEVELAVPVVPKEKIFNVKYLENCERYDVILKRDQIGNHQWAIDWNKEI